MSSLASVYFASAVAGAAFFGEAVLRATFGCVHSPFMYQARMLSSRSRLSTCCTLLLTLLWFKHSRSPTFANSCRREKTVTTIVMMILTVVMFGISTTIFSLETYLFSDGLLHPQKYPKTFIDLYGPVTTTQIILQGLNVRHTWF